MAGVLRLRGDTKLRSTPQAMVTSKEKTSSRGFPSTRPPWRARSGRSRRCGIANPSELSEGEFTLRERSESKGEPTQVESGSSEPTLAGESKGYFCGSARVQLKFYLDTGAFRIWASCQQSTDRLESILRSHHVISPITSLELMSQVNVPSAKAEALSALRKLQDSINTGEAIILKWMDDFLAESLFSKQIISDDPSVIRDAVAGILSGSEEKVKMLAKCVRQSLDELKSRYVNAAQKVAADLKSQLGHIPGKNSVRGAKFAHLRLRRLRVPHIRSASRPAGGRPNSTVYEPDRRVPVGRSFFFSGGDR